MKHHHQDRLLNEILDGKRLETLRHATLESGLGALRRRRQKRRIAQVCMLASLPLIALAMLLLYTQSRVQSVVKSDPASLPLAVGRNASPQIKLLTDEELFALFPNRSMALVGKPGHQQLIFLDPSQTVPEPVTQ